MDKPRRIVLIDDNETDVAVTRRLLERSGFDVVPAHSGEEGLRLARDVVPDVIVVDYRMPVMDGFEVARRAKADPQLQTIPLLMLTGIDSAQHVVDGLAAGADDFVTKGSDVEVIIARLRTLLRMKAYQDQLRMMNRQMTRDLQIARRVQEALIPRGPFRGPGIEIRSAYIPSDALSGDFYDYFLTGSSLYLFMADVSGHGLPAAILVSLLKSYIRTQADPQSSLADFMRELNDFLFGVSLPNQFATAQLFRVDEGRHIVYANAGHPPFLLYQRECGTTAVFEEPGNLLGAMPGMAFEERALEVSAGDTLLVYTDGLTDRRTESGEFYSIDRVAAILERWSDTDVNTLYDAIYEDVSDFPSTEEFRDDIAFVVARFG
jgi:serine phosphatase RsbU (regulator of sigma subunit)